MGEAQVSSFTECDHPGNLQETAAHSCSHTRCDPTCPGAGRGKGFLSPHQMSLWVGGISQLEEAVDGRFDSGSSGEPHRRSLWLQPLPVLPLCTCSSPDFTFLLPVQGLCLTSAMPRALSGTDLATGAGTVPSQHPCGVGSIPCLLLPQPSLCPHGGRALAVPKLCQGPLELSMNGAPAPENISQLCFIHKSR